MVMDNHPPVRSQSIEHGMKVERRGGESMQQEQGHAAARTDIEVKDLVAKDIRARASVAPRFEHRRQESHRAYGI